MAGQAVIQDFLRAHQREGVWDGGPSAARLDMRLPGSVTAFTPGPRGRLGSRSNTLIVRVLVKVQPDIRVACFADGAADVFG